MPALSVAMGVYNIEALPQFSHAIRSILGQTFENFELLLCDDGSTDATWEILTGFSREDARVRLLKNSSNLGLAATLNHCIAEASAPFLVRHDADDYSTADRFRLQRTFLDAHPEIDFVGSWVALYDQNGIYATRCFPAYPEPEDFLFTVPFLHGALMFRKEALTRIGGYRVSRETRRTEDYELLMRMYANGMRGANLPESLYCFLENQAAQSRRKYRYRIDEAMVRWEGFSSLGLLPGAFPYVIKPLLVGLLPAPLLTAVRRRRFKKETVE